MDKEHSSKKTESKKEAKKKGRPKKAGIVKKPVKKIINPENYFFLSDGRILKDLIELSECLETVNKDTFFYHVNDSRNDFSNWIKDIFEYHDLSDDILTVREPRQMQIIILKHLAKKR